ncbi:MAG TPA: YceI family protein [Thermoanaerobaculia bacterium]|nr:YceI family protein [Thermoanaerobaculia bacterium]
MRISQRAVLILLAAFAALFALPGHAEQRVLILDPAASKVTFTLDATGHDVEGVLAVQSGRIAFDSETGAASGEIAIDLKKAATGNNSRDKTMHNEVLETPKYPLAVFKAEKVRGTVAPSGPSQVTLDGTLAFHGADHKMSLPAKVNVQNGRVTGTTELTIPFVEWGLHDPSIMVLRVAKTVAVHVKVDGTLEGAGGAAGN